MTAKYVAIGPMCWGASEGTAANAVKNAKKHASKSLLSPGKHVIAVYRVENFLGVDGMGRIEYKGAQPEELESVSWIVRR